MTPIDAERSAGPANTTSTPSTEAMASRLAMPSGLSICTITQVSSLAAGR